jgi:hypothetical protein
LHWCDLVITTPQYQLPEHPRIVQNLLPLNRPDPAQSAAACREWAPRFAHLPRPRLGLLLGGDSGSYRFTVGAARELGRRLNARTRAAQGSLLITSSPRTPHDALEALLGELSVPSYCHRWHADDPGGNPILAILNLCDALVVTADSASMLAEACATGCPVSVFAPPSRPLAAMIERPWLPARLGPARTALQRLHRSLVIHGLWVPARNMTRLHRALEQRRLVRPIETLTENDNANRQTPDDMERAVAAIHDLFPAADANRHL